MPLTEEQRAQVQKVFESFLKNRADKIRELTIDALNINAFLIRLLAREMELHSADSIVRWLVSQRFERGSVTSLGTWLQSAAKLFSEGTGAEGADIVKRDTRGVRWYIQVKSGPNAIPKDHADRLAELLQSVRRRDPGSDVLLGICYGNESHVSNVIQRYVGDRGGVNWMTGRAFWEFISGDPHAIDEIYEIAATVGDNYRSPDGKTLNEILDERIGSLVGEFRAKYGESGDEMWRRLLDFNS